MAASQTRQDIRLAVGPPVSMSHAACLTVQRPDRPCAACATACPERAIRIRGRDVSVRHMSCSACGICATVCPTGAIGVAGFATDVTPAARWECSRVREPAGTVVTCLGGIGADDLRTALLDGDVTLVDRGWCAGCPVSGGRAAPWADALATVNAEMEALGVPQRVTVGHAPLAGWRARPAPRPATDNPGRRALFNRIAAGGEADANRATIPDKAQTPGPARRLAALTRLLDGQPVPRALFPAYRLAGTKVDLAAVAQLCPTTALSVIDAETRRALIFDPAACIACGACVDAGALMAAPEPEGVFTGPETLAAEARAICTRCRARFTPKRGQNTCGACARDTDLAALTHGLMRRNRSQDHSI